MLIKFILGLLSLFPILLQGQNKNQTLHFFLDDCYKILDSIPNKTTVYDGIGKVTLFDVKNISDKLSIKYFSCPTNLSKKKSLEYIKNVGDTHAKMWQNNSIYIKKKQSKINNNYAYVVNIFLNFENKKMQIICVRSRDKIFEIISFSEPDSLFNNKIYNDLKHKKCL